ncbi:IclR family transcriptional regulator domain-containing protein [Aeromicrobium wangtongii]|uniref:IclR family transcriptional regulator domain-containing protein n=1 Tax=Aeromicrobium wangtongii TaxID=2969247 RepID=UPI00201765CA|nr:IclR family transcriptional regulator C-terminal domain-containing protein [Aeromicrobium wangtongii]MCL3820013.1 helix-turn-helix domain-containing protein [Aeromicrobium wangtongii]
MTPEPRVAGEQFVQSLSRGLSVITAFDAEHAAMTLSEVAVRTDLSRATARRFLHTLVELGYVRTDGRLFSLTPQVLRLGTAYLSGSGLPQIAQPHLERLSAELGESTSAAVLDGADIVYVARVATRRIMSVGITVGTRFPAYATSMGRVLLAGMASDALDACLASTDLVPLTPSTLHTPDDLRAEVARVRENGWSFVDQELEQGLRSLAVPVTDPGGRVVAALNVSASMAANDPADFVSAALPPLQAAAAAVSADLAHTA